LTHAPVVIKRYTNLFSILLDLPEAALLEFSAVLFLVQRGKMNSFSRDMTERTLDSLRFDSGC